jgi:hypothetical protein
MAHRRWTVMTAVGTGGALLWAVPAWANGAVAADLGNDLLAGPFRTALLDPATHEGVQPVDARCRPPLPAPVDNRCSARGSGLAGDRVAQRSPPLVGRSRSRQAVGRQDAGWRRGTGP